MPDQDPAKSGGGDHTMPKIGWHFDFHSHRNIRINHDQDVTGMAELLEACGVEEVITFAKDHTGFAYYPTRVGTVHPRMKGDAFGEVTAACKRKGLRVLAYISFGVDGEAGRRHPEWVMMKEPGVPDFFSEDWFANLCPFTPYLDEHVLPMIAEVVADYPVDGFFFDTMGALRICYCDTCRAAFLDTHGLLVPEKPEDENWGTYGQFRHDRGWEMIGRVCRFIHDCRPGLEIGFNQIGTVRYPERAPDRMSRLTLDFTTAGPQSLQASLCAAFASTTDRSSDVMNTIFNQGWGDWSPRPPAVIDQTCAAIWARKSRPYMGDRLHPANRLTSISIKAMKQVAALQQEMARYYPAADASLTPDVVLVHGPGTMYGANLADFDRDRSGIKPLIGAHRLLLDSGANFTIAAEAFLEQNLDHASLIILPEMRAVDERTNRLLQTFVEQGGHLLLTGDLPVCSGSSLDWVGVHRDAGPWQDHIYLPSLEANGEVEHVLVKGDVYRWILDGAECVLPAIAPYDCDHGIRFGQGIGPPEVEPSAWPVLTRHTWGAGAVSHLAVPIFSDYEAHGNWTQIAWMRSLLATLIPDALASLRADAPGVEVVVHSNGRSTWAFLINHGGEELIGERGWARTFAPLPCRSVVVRLQDRRRRQPARVTVQGQDADWQIMEDRVHIAVRLDSPWAVIKIDWQEECPPHE